MIYSYESFYFFKPLPTKVERRKYCWTLKNEQVENSFFFKVSIPSPLIYHQKVKIIKQKQD